jgi:hypothetical protein
MQKKAKRHGPQRSLSIYLLFHADSDKITIYKTKPDYLVIMISKFMIFIKTLKNI